ncbi:baseplate J/gp47 family protein [Ascidiimonas aurantiaca]|uniref:baseplate J/gp47 family protein n=1 Tax=Ascidiimonas aurantiaca TaxID=1685432 RepID=UPI0030EF8974
MTHRRNGTIRDNRFNKDLTDSSFRIDQRTFWDVMGYVASYLEYINYYNLENEKEGNWRVFVENDPLIFMCIIINEPLNELDKLIRNHRSTEVSRSENLNTVKVLIAWYRKINFWYQKLYDLNEKKLAYKIKNILSDVLMYVKRDLDQYETQLSAIKDVVKKEPEAEDPVTVGGFMPPPPNFATGKPIDISKAIHTFHRIIVHIQQFTKVYLEKNFFGRDKHLPNNALYIAFALLFKKVQADINTLSGRHLDFYYKDILQQTINNGTPTQTIVSFDLLPTIPYALIEKGTRLSAGKLFGSKTDILFETKSPLVANQIKITELQTLAFNSNPYIKVGTEFPLISSVTKKDLVTNGLDSSDRSNWYLFGSNYKYLKNARVNEGEAASLGFIIGSPVLILSEGYRQIDIVFSLEQESSQNTLWKLLKEIKENRKVGMDIAFASVFNNAFNIAYSSEKGWALFENYEILYDETLNTLTLQVILDSGAPALVYSEKAAGALQWPSIKVSLNDYAPVFVYSFLKGVIIDTIHIRVSVERMKDVSLYNQIGKMPLGKVFELFGPLPEVGSYVMIGKSELFQKQINTMTIGFNWDSLPADYGGFTTYYDGYPGNITNSSFKVHLSVLSNGYWLPLNHDPSLEAPLFQTHKALTPEGYESEQLNNTSNLNLDSFGKLVSEQDFRLKEPLVYTVNSRSGFFKLTLTAPEDGFGNNQYQKEFTEIATFNAKNKTQIPYPNKPFVPKVSGISLNYEASDTLIFNEELSKNTVSGENTGTFSHITPFGPEPVITDQIVYKNTLLPDFEAEGYLFLGLSGVTASTTISVYFELSSATVFNALRKDKLSWEYYRLNQWVPFEDGNIIFDDTNGFIKSGIIELTLPYTKQMFDEQEDNTYWIRISAFKNASYYPVIRGIYMNAVSTVCISDNPEITGRDIPAGSIVKLEGKHPDIKSVKQPTISFGGRKVETETQFYNRVSERLRHKDRAISIWDYERLILENFDSVRVVKCTNLNKDFRSVPGEVKVIVLSNQWSHTAPFFYNSDVLERMKAFLMNLTGPFVNIQVVNPVVEYLLVKCIITLEPKDQGGFYMNLLNTDISNFLSPISKLENGVGGIGGTVVPTMLVSYMENLSYIKNVKKLVIEHIVQKGTNNYLLGVYRDSEEIKTTTPWSILAPVNQHQILSFNASNSEESDLRAGIGNMEIGLDLILEDKAPEHTARDTTPEIPEDSEIDKKKRDKKPYNAIFVFKAKS